MKHWVTTERALGNYLKTTDREDLFEFKLAGECWPVVSIDSGQTRYLIHEKDNTETPRIILIDFFEQYSSLKPAILQKTLERVHLASRRAVSKPISLPRDWGSYQHASFVSFFATPQNLSSYRLLLELNPTKIGDCCFWEIAPDGEYSKLEDFSPNREEHKTAVDAWRVAHAEGERILCPPKSSTGVIQQTVDLETRTTSQAVVGSRTYSQWLPLLTEKQQSFVESSTNRSIKLRGAAGSGKTLALAMKVLRELYRAQDSGEDPRVLFATHSWSVAEHVDRILESLDERGVYNKVDIFPLLTIAHSLFESNAEQLEVLGEDSLSGKKLQLELVAEIIENTRRGDWLTYRSQVTDKFRQRVEADKNSDQRQGLVWDLMNEFASVLAAHGIMPGVNALRRYQSISRLPWMMPVSNEAEQRFIIDVHSKYIRELRQQGALTADQLISDFVNLMETFSWDVQRREEGYDLIFVDELHLFSEQERLVLNYLTRNPESYPKMFMAMDPRQSPMEIFAGIDRSETSVGTSGEAEESLGDVELVVLDNVYRFTPEVLNFLRHINRDYPALDLGEDWQLDLDSTDSEIASGSVPCLYTYSNWKEEMEAVLENGFQANTSSRDIRVAVLSLDPLKLDDLEGLLASGYSRYSLVKSRDDVAELGYTKQSLVISAPEYVAGLQFSHVFVCGVVNPETSSVPVGYRLRRFLSALYLAVSRAEEEVHICVNDEFGGIPTVLESALKDGCLVTSS